MMIRKVLGVMVSIFGLGVAALWIGLWLGGDEAGRFECDRALARCVVHSEGRSTELPLESIRSVHVSYARSVGDSLVLMTASATMVLAGQTMDGDSCREYREAAGAIRAFLEGQTASVDMSYTQRVGIADLLFVGGFGAFMAVGGVFVWKGPKRDE